VAWSEFNGFLNAALTSSIAERNCRCLQVSYNPAKQIRGQMRDEPEGIWTIHADLERKRFTVSG